MSEKNRDLTTSDDYRDPVIEAYKKDVDRTLIRENLKLTPDQRLKQLESLMRGIGQMNRAGRESKAALAFGYACCMFSGNITPDGMRTMLRRAKTMAGW